MVSYANFTVSNRYFCPGNFFKTNFTGVVTKVNMVLSGNNGDFLASQKLVCKLCREFTACNSVNNQLGTICCITCHKYSWNLCFECFFVTVYKSPVIKSKTIANRINKCHVRILSNCTDYGIAGLYKFRSWYWFRSSTPAGIRWSQLILL